MSASCSLTQSVSLQKQEGESCVLDTKPNAGALNSDALVKEGFINMTAL